MFPTEGEKGREKNKTGEMERAGPRIPLGNLRSGSISIFRRLRRSEKSNLHDTATNSMSDSDPTKSVSPSVRPLRRLELIVDYAHPPATDQRHLRCVARNDASLRSACYKRTDSAQPLYRFLLARRTQDECPFRGHYLERVLRVHATPGLVGHARWLGLVSALFRAQDIGGHIKIERVQYHLERYLTMRLRVLDRSSLSVMPQSFLIALTMWLREYDNLSSLRTNHR